MRTEWKRQVVVATALLLGLLWTPWGSAEARAVPCGPVEQLPVTLLVRPGEGYPFVGLDPENHAPYIDIAQSRTMVPLRPLFAALSPHGESASWDEHTRTANFWRGEHQLSIHFPQQSTRAYSASLNGRAVPLNTYLCNGRVYGPARAVMEAFDIGIEYYENGIVAVDPARRLPIVDIRPGRVVPVQVLNVINAPSCEPWPEHILQFLTRPSAAARQAAKAAACRLIQGR